MKPQGQVDSCLGVTGQAWEPCSKPPNEPLRLWPVCDLISDFIYRCPIGFSQGECTGCVCVCVCVCMCVCVTAHVFLNVYVCEWGHVHCYWTKLGYLPMQSEASLLTPACDEGKCSLLQVPTSSPGSLCAESRNSLMGFRRPFLKSRWGRGSEHI